MCWMEVRNCACVLSMCSVFLSFLHIFDESVTNPQCYCFVFLSNNCPFPAWLPPTLCGVKHASNLAHDDQWLSCGVGDTLQTVTGKVLGVWMLHHMVVMPVMQRSAQCFQLLILLVLVSLLCACFSADFRFGICCMSEMLNEGEIKKRCLFVWWGIKVDLHPSKRLIDLCSARSCQCEVFTLSLIEDVPFRCFLSNLVDHYSANWRRKQIARFLIK